MSEITSLDDEIKIGRVGHYRASETQGCWHASIVKVHPKQFDSDAGGELPRQINLAGFDPDGNAYSRRGIAFGADEPGFHLNRDCPDQR